MLDTQFLNRAMLLGGAVGFVVAGLLWPDWVVGRTVFGALSDLLGPSAGVLVSLLPPFVAGVVAGAFSTFERTAEVVTDGALAGTLTGFGVITVTVGASGIGQALAGGASDVVGVVLVVTVSAALAAVPGVVGGFIADELGLRADATSATDESSESDR